MTTDSPGPLRRALDAAAAKAGCSLADLTVLAQQLDPYRQDTPANHRDAAWLRDRMADLPAIARHLRGLHYAVLGTTKPNGDEYRNTDADWTWLSESAAKAARWLGYVRWDAIEDQRNALPYVMEHEPPTEAAPTVNAEFDVWDLPTDDDVDLCPTAVLGDVVVRQPYRLVLWGEKTSLRPVLSRLARRYDADLYLTAGEISDTLIHRMARTADGDGRPMVLVTFSDCDPSGWQMPVSIAHKLSAFKDLVYPDFDFIVVRAALTPEQAQTLGLPSMPFKVHPHNHPDPAKRGKPTDKRAELWKQATGIEQTEIDALAALQPDVLEAMGGQALDPFFDARLAERVRQATETWTAAAQRLVDEHVDTEEVEALEDDARAALDGLRANVDRINDELADLIPDVELPEFVAPAPADFDENWPPVLSDSTWSLADRCQALRASKRYLDD